MLPYPCAFGIVAPAVVIDDRTQCLQMLRALEGEAPQRILAFEGAAADAKVRPSEAAAAQLDRGSGRFARAPGRLVPARVEMPQ